MANNLVSNPLRIDTAAAAWAKEHKSVRLIQWIDLNEDIADSDELSMVINGVAVQCELQVEVTANYGTIGAVLWNIGPFSPGIDIIDFEVVTIDGGVVYVWID